MQSEHSPYGGSQVARYMACPGSVALIANAPPEAPSRYAEEGTTAHKIAAECLTEEAYTEDEDIQLYLDAVREEFKRFPEDLSHLQVEVKFDLHLEAAEGRAYGTADAVVYHEEHRRLVVFDFKYGQGVFVGVENNLQAKFYALGALEAHPDWNPREIELVIVQPRTPFGESIRRWTMPLIDIIEYRYEVNEAIKATKDPEAPVVAGPHCQFCPASTICTAREEALVAAISKDFEGVSLPDLPAITVCEQDFEHMGRIIEAYDNMAAQINDMRTAISEHLLGGGIVPGWKVVEKQSRRQYAASDAEIADWLYEEHGVPKDETLHTKVVAITAAEKLLKDYAEDYSSAKKEFTERFTTKPSAGLTVAPESDRREAVNPITSEFGSVMLGSVEDE